MRVICEKLLALFGNFTDKLSRFFDTLFESTSLIGLMLICLSSCSYYQHYVDNERELKNCRLICLEKLKNCSDSCMNNCRTCSAFSNIGAASRFKKYKHKQLVQGKIVALELQSFKDPLQCRKATCSCQEDFRVCAQSCRGTIYKSRKTVAAC